MVLRRPPGTSQQPQEGAHSQGLSLKGAPGQRGLVEGLGQAPGWAVPAARVTGTRCMPPLAQRFRQGALRSGTSRRVDVLRTRVKEDAVCWAVLSPRDMAGKLAGDTPCSRHLPCSGDPLPTKQGLPITPEPVGSASLGAGKAQLAASEGGVWVRVGEKGQGQVCHLGGGNHHFPVF